ncbi:integrase [Methylobacterium fujisawaense]|uniref:integrase n=1 Tax=Methylobacterium fujisawaense TaxID=107400 RepID=UPI0031F4AB93
MPSELSFPGLKRRARKSGPHAAYWVARADLVRTGYQPETVRIPYDLDDPDQQMLASALCMKLQAEMLEWASGRRRDPNRFDGTLLSLSKKYQTDEASPFNTNMKHNTRRTDLSMLRLIERTVGARQLAQLGNDDFRRWYNEAKKPKAPGGPERVRRGYGLIKKLRELFSFGIMAGLPQCKRLHEILSHARFAQPARRRITLKLEHVEAFIPVALEQGRLSLALCTAIQFEAVLRQRDVIGEWMPIPDGEEPSGIVINERRWQNGLTWADLAGDMVVRKVTTKTGAIVAHDFKLYALVIRLLDMVPAAKRVGPLIINEHTGKPYAEWVFTREWRAVARAAGIPDEVRNMDARAGGITEADDAGADFDSIKSTAAHANASTTQRYMRGAVGKARNVAVLRAAHRAKENKA